MRIILDLFLAFGTSLMQRAKHLWLDKILLYDLPYMDSLLLYTTTDIIEPMLS